MEQDLNYSKAEHPEEMAILWVALRPFQVGHKLLFHRIASPFMFSGKVGLNDLLDAILICSCDYRESTRVLRRLNFTARLWTWFIRFICWRNPARIEDAISEFRDYLAKAGEPRPRTWKTRGKTRLTHVPEILNLKMVLMQDCRFTESEVMAMPVIKAYWHFEAWLERKGAVNFIGEEEQSRLSRIREKQKGLFIN